MGQPVEQRAGEPFGAKDRSPILEHPLGLGALLAGNSAKPSREQLTLIQVFDELRGRGYEGGYGAVRRYARAWAKERGQMTAAAYVPLSFAPGEAYQFDW